MPLEGGDIISLATLKGDIEFKDVAFSYPSRPHQASKSCLNVFLKYVKMNAVFD